MKNEKKLSHKFEKHLKRTKNFGLAVQIYSLFIFGLGFVDLDLFALGIMTFMCGSLLKENCSLYSRIHKTLKENYHLVDLKEEALKTIKLLKGLQLREEDIIVSAGKKLKSVSVKKKNAKETKTKK